jgi:molecular chaperone IbpA
MATFDISPLFRPTPVAFDRTWHNFDAALASDSTRYPAYNLLRVAEDEFQICLATPGFERKEIAIELRDGLLSIQANRKIDPNHNQYLYRGIDQQGFQKTFRLPEYVKVKQARLSMGMLYIDLYRELPESLRPRRIEISDGAQTKPVLEDTSKAA